MCGIVGYIGERNAQPILLKGLKNLEYRGYDSAGIAVCSSEGIALRKVQGQVEALQSLLEQQACSGQAGIGHTRWATHGKPTDCNAHPHCDPSGKFAVVHNGIVENYAEIRREFEQKGSRFSSDTDSEVIAHLIAKYYAGDLAKAVLLAVRQLKGAYVIAVVSEYEPDKLVAVKQGSPLIVGIGEGERFIASDIPAVLEFTRNVIILEDDEAAVLSRDFTKVINTQGNVIVKDPFYVDWNVSLAEKNGYDHFMLKEIFEQASAIRSTMASRLTAGDNKSVDLGELELSADELQRVRNIQIVACGTSYHAGLVGKSVIERLTRIPVEVEVASEYRYRGPIITKDTLVIAVSQSGETADTLAAMREAKVGGAKVIAITNVVGSSAAREADAVLYTWAGPEIAVASTKAYTTQLIAFYMFGIYFASQLNNCSREILHALIDQLHGIPEKIEELLERTDPIKELAERLSRFDHLFFIGRGLDYATAMEASLKLKEISYIHSEAYPAGELKHGTLALIEEGTPVIAIVTQHDVADKTVNNIKEVKTRGAAVYGVVSQHNGRIAAESLSFELEIPDTADLLFPVLSAVPLQLLAYYAAVFKGMDPDKPRNLAKSVTVE